MNGFFVLVLVVVLYLWRRDASTFGQGERNVQRSRRKSRTRTIGNRSPTRRHADTPIRFSTTPGFVAPKWAKDFSLGRSPRNPRKSHQALKAFQKKLRSATERGKKLAFLRPYRAGRILDAFPGAPPQAFVFRPVQGVRSPTEERVFRSRPRPRSSNVETATISRTGASLAQEPDSTKWLRLSTDRNRGRARGRGRFKRTP
jgi:hypothetical protein